MKVVYVDSSIVVRYYLPNDPGRGDVVALLNDDDVAVITSTLTRIESSGALVRAARSTKTKAADALAALEAHLEKRGFGDIEVIMSGGYDPTSTSATAPLIKAQVATLEAEGLDPLMWPRSAGSYPGYIFTQPPLSLASGHFGLGHGSGAHAPDEYFVIESTNPNVQGWDGAVMSYVKYLFELAK